MNTIWNQEFTIIFNPSVKALLFNLHLLFSNVMQEFRKIYILFRVADNYGWVFPCSIIIFRIYYTLNNHSKAHINVYDRFNLIGKD